MAWDWGRGWDRVLPKTILAPRPQTGAKSKAVSAVSAVSFPPSARILWIS